MLRTLVILSLSALVTASCYKLKPDDQGAMNSTTSPTESALATVNSLANDSEALTFDFDAAQDFNRPSCKSQNVKSECNSNNQINVNWGECSAPSGATYKGGWTSTYSSASACSRGKTGPLANGDSVVRTSTGMAIENGSGGRVLWNTNLHPTYDQITISDAGLSVSRWGDTRTLSIAGIHRFYQNSSGATLYDHSIQTLNQISMTGQRANGTRALSSGVLRVYSNTDKTHNDVTFSGLQWRNASCCFPTSGTITTTSSGARYSTISLHFDRANCGQVSVEQNGKTTLANLTQCE